MEESEISRVIKKAESGSRKLRLTFKSTAVIDDIRFFCSVERIGVFEIDSAAAETLTEIMCSQVRGDGNRTITVGLGRSFEPKWLITTRLAEALEKLEAI